MINGSSRHDDAAQTIYIYNAKHAALRRKNKDWLARNQNNVYIYLQLFDKVTRWNAFFFFFKLYGPGIWELTK